jgi:hypothetical protein
MKAYGGADVYIHILLTSALVGGEWSTSRPGRFTPREKGPGTHWIGSWVDLRAGLDDLEKIKLLTLPGLELRPLGRYTDYAIPAPHCFAVHYTILTLKFHHISKLSINIAPSFLRNIMKDMLS